jgi:hypothetical protein
MALGPRCCLQYPAQAAGNAWHVWRLKHSALLITQLPHQGHLLVRAGIRRGGAGAAGGNQDPLLTQPTCVLWCCIWKCSRICWLCWPEQVAAAPPFCERNGLNSPGGWKSDQRVCARAYASNVESCLPEGTEQPPGPTLLLARWMPSLQSARPSHTRASRMLRTRSKVGENTPS